MYKWLILGSYIGYRGYQLLRSYIIGPVKTTNLRYRNDNSSNPSLSNVNSILHAWLHCKRLFWSTRERGVHIQRAHLVEFDVKTRWSIKVVRMLARREEESLGMNPSAMRNMNQVLTVSFNMQSVNLIKSRMPRISQDSLSSSISLLASEKYLKPTSHLLSSTTTYDIPNSGHYWSFPIKTIPLGQAINPVESKPTIVLVLVYFLLFS